MKKLIALAIFLSFFGVNLAWAQTGTSNAPSVPPPQENRGFRRFIPFLRRPEPAIRPISTSTPIPPRPFATGTATGTGIGRDVSGVNREAEEQIKALRQEMEAKIRAIRSEYEMRIKAIRDNAKTQVEQIKLQKKQEKSTSTNSGFLLRLLGRD